MKSRAMLGTALLTATLMAGEIDPKLLSFIPPDAKVVCGIDLERYRHSTLAEFYPVHFDLLSAGTGRDAGHQIRHVILISFGPSSIRPPMTVLQGALSLPQIQASDGERNQVSLYQGIPILSAGEAGFIALPSQTTAILGDEDEVREAIDRWGLESDLPEDIAAQIVRLSKTYDNWFLALEPLANAGRSGSARGSKYAVELMQSVEEARGGILFGGANDVRVELVMKTPDDALALEAMSRWLPGLVQMEGSNGRESQLTDLVENLVVQAQGPIVSVSFSIAEDKLQDLVSSRRAQRQYSQ